MENLEADVPLFTVKWTNPLELELESDWLDWPSQNISETKKDKTCCYLLTTFSDLLRPVQKCRLCWDVFPVPSDINQLWVPIWEVCKKELLPLKKDPLLRSRLFTCLPMIWPIPVIFFLKIKIISSCYYFLTFGCDNCVV